MKNKMGNQQLVKCKNIKEIFKKISHTKIYAVSNKGRVKNIKTGKLLSPRDLKGYKRVNLYYNGKNHDKRIHRLVGEAFIKNPLNKPEINHKDGVRDNNCVLNLEWCTPKENCQHKVKVLGVGNTFKGEKNGNAKLSKEVILLIRQSSIKSKYLAVLFDVTETHINRIKNNILWKHIDSSTTIEQT